MKPTIWAAGTPVLLALLREHPVPFRPILWPLEFPECDNVTFGILSHSILSFLPGITCFPIPAKTDVSYARILGEPRELM